jgi:Na+/melibiose symporter-like transporter
VGVLGGSARIRSTIAAACGSAIGAVVVGVLFVSLLDRAPDEAWVKVLIGGAFWLAASAVAGLGAWFATRPFYPDAAKTGLSVFVIGGLLPYPAYVIWLVVRPDPALLYLTMAMIAGVVAQLLVTRLDWSGNTRVVDIGEVA